MIILFATERLRDECNNEKILRSVHGPQRAKLITRRLTDLSAAERLEYMRNLPGKTHELKHDRKGQLSIALDGPMSLIFVPSNDPVPLKKDGGLDWKEVTAITIMEIANYHG